VECFFYLLVDQSATASDLYSCNRLVHPLAHPGEGNVRAAMRNADLPLAIQQDQASNILNTLPEEIDSIASRFWCAVARANRAHRAV
jgi:ABC-type molybdate transport system ATPase subunit